MNSPVDHTSMVVGRSAAGEKMSLSKLKHSVTLERRYNAKYDSKYRHKPYFRTSNGHRIIAGLPVWASVLIFVAIVIVGLFIVGLIVGFIRERSRSLESGKSMRWKKVFLSAFSVAFFLWIPVYIVRFIKSRTGKGGSYSEIDEDKQRLNATTTTTETTKPWNMDRASASAASRYEPMGYQSSVYDPYSAYAGVSDPSVVGQVQPSPTGASSKEADAARPVSPVGATGFHQPPPLQDSGDLGGRSPSPPRASFSPAHPPPTYNA